MFLKLGLIHRYYLLDSNCKLRTLRLKVKGLFDLAYKLIYASIHSTILLDTAGFFPLRKTGIYANRLKICNECCCANPFVRLSSFRRVKSIQIEQSNEKLGLIFLNVWHSCPIFCWALVALLPPLGNM